MIDQPAFRAALLDAGQPVPEGLLDGMGRAAGSRFDVYRNNVAVSLTEALEAGFPAVVKLLGAQNFRSLAGLFLRAHPPGSPLMMQYGDAFPGFLEAFEPLAKFPYLGDVARLELALRRSYHAADSTPADPAILQTLDEDALMAAHFALAPSVQLVRSPWPVVALWEFNMVPGAPKPGPRPQDALITRVEFDPVPHALSHGGGAFIAALLDKAPFGRAQESAIAHDPDFDLGALLGLLLSQAAITEIA